MQAVMSYLGEEGYLRLVDQTMRYIKRFQDGIDAIEGLTPVRLDGRPL